jgi:hypothetical protein
VIEHPDVNLIVVATPDALHYEEIMAAVAKGKHVFCDKPVAMNAAEANEMWAACRDALLDSLHCLLCSREGNRRVGNTRRDQGSRLSVAQQSSGVHTVHLARQCRTVVCGQCW